MNEQPKPAADEGRPFGPLIFLGLPIAVEVVTLYVLIAVETPVTPMVHRLVEHTGGLVVLAAGSLSAVVIVMLAFYSIAEHLRRKRAERADRASDPT